MWHALRRRGIHAGFCGILEGKSPLGKPRRKCENNIEINLREIGWGVMDWIYLARDKDQWRALVDTVMNLLVS
jgi:hypothetical protein